MDPYVKMVDVQSKTKGFVVTLLYENSKAFHGLAIFIGKGRSHSVLLKITVDAKDYYIKYFRTILLRKVKLPAMAIENKTLSFEPKNGGILVKLKIGKWWLTPTLEGFLPRSSVEEIIEAIENLPI